MVGPYATISMFLREGKSHASFDAILGPVREKSDVSVVFLLIYLFIKTKQNKGTMEQRNKGTKEQKNNGKTGQRNKGTMEQRNKGAKE